MQKLSSAVAVAVLAALTASGCGTVLFNDSFDTDTLGSPPAASPSGPPANDLVYLSDTSGVSTEIVSGSGAGDRELRYMKQPGSAPSRFLGFISQEISPGARAFTATWNGVAEVLGGEGPLDIWLGNAHFGAIVGFRIEGGRILKRTGSDTYSDIGAFPNGTSHSVVWTVDRDAATHTLSITGGGASVSVSEPVIDGASSPHLAASRPTLYVWFSSGGAGNSTYTLDDVRIAETDA